MHVQRKPEDDAISTEDAKKPRTEEPNGNGNIVEAAAKPTAEEKVDESTSSSTAKKSEEKMEIQEEVNIN